MSSLGLLCMVVKMTECSLYRDGEIQLEFVNERITFDAAEERCKSKNAQLIELQDEEEYDEVNIENTIAM